MKPWRKRAKERPKEWFLANGSTFLQKLIADCNGKSNPIRIFSSDQILRATNNFNPSCSISGDGHFTWYRGIIEDRVHAIKKFSDAKIRADREQEVYNDIVISTRVSDHPNFLRLLGCCLEFPLPVLVFEYAENGVLDLCGGICSNDRSFLPWDLRVKVSKEVANAVTYLHTVFPRIIIHRDIKPTHVFLDKNWTAKLSDFSFSISLPEGKTRVKDDVRGTPGYLDPLYYSTNIVTEYTDVFSFGVFMMVLLIRRPAVFAVSNGPIHIRDYVKGLQEEGESIEIAEAAIDVRAGQILHMERFLELALRCCANRDEDRPKMIEVAKELKQIEKLLGATPVGSS